MAVQYSVHDDVALLAISYPPVNALGYEVRKGLLECSGKAFADQSIKALVIVGEGKTFPAGADVSEFSKGTTAEFPLTEVIAHIEAGPKPVIAAIHGTALGGGLELALGCHFRLAVPSAKVGLPEVHLGIIPGAGGTQRLPRVTPAVKAAEIISSGAQAALKAGILDRVIPAGEDLRTAALAVARSLMSSPLDSMRVSGRPVVGGREALSELAALKSVVAKKARGMKSPVACVEAVQAAVESASFEDGMNEEMRIMFELFTDPQARALQYAFFAERQAKKVPELQQLSPSDRPAQVQSVGIIGAGTMGAGIAVCFLDAGIPVVLVDMQQAALDRGVGYIQHTYDSKVKSKRMAPATAEKRMSMLRGALDYGAVSEVDLVVEAAFEGMAIKKDIFGKLDKICKADTILATNTSTLDIDVIASATFRPDKVVGMHFFSPANIMMLLEVVKGKASSKRTLATAFALAGPLKKVAVMVGNCHGFVGNRMVYTYGAEAVFLVEEGASPAQVDGVLEKFGLAMGPLKMSDLAGLDVSWRVRQ
eukprot:gene5613-6798_t